MLYVYDGKRNASDVVILSAKDFAAPALALVERLRVPFGLHGDWPRCSALGRRKCSDLCSVNWAAFRLDGRAVRRDRERCHIPSQPAPMQVDRRHRSDHELSYVTLQGVSVFP